ncbi:MAG TPA: hypothetical protein VLB87_06150 [Pyrinomonadaceae bacterium]|nr:hypothetical protein [Pyrinomonadaceae bacterium]
MTLKLDVTAPGTVVLSSTDTLLELRFATTRSSLPSPLRSPEAIARGLALVAKSCLPAKLAGAASAMIAARQTVTSAAINANIVDGTG